MDVQRTALDTPQPHGYMLIVQNQFHFYYCVDYANLITKQVYGIDLQRIVIFIQGLEAIGLPALYLSSVYFFCRCVVLLAGVVLRPKRFDERGHCPCTGHL